MTAHTDENFVADMDLDISLDDIMDLPEFVRVPTGAYKLSLPEGITDKILEAKDGKPEIKFFEAGFILTEVVDVKPEALDEGEEMPKPGSLLTFSYNKNNKFGIGALKSNLLIPIAKATGANSLGSCIGASKGMEFLAVITRKASKNDPDKLYNRIKTCAAL